MQVYIILFGLGMEEEGIYSLRAIRREDYLPQDTIIAFVESDDAERYVAVALLSCSDWRCLNSHSRVCLICVRARFTVKVGVLKGGGGGVVTALLFCGLKVLLGRGGRPDICASLPLMCSSVLI